jgi:primary-amine oxidase
VPHSGDIPNTLMHTSASSVMFTPFNFHDSDPTRLSAQGVRITDENGETKVEYYGGRYQQGVSLKEVGILHVQTGCEVR